MMAETSFLDKKVIAKSQFFVCVIAHRETAHGETEVVIGREKKSLCNEYQTIPCEVHTKGDSATGKFYSGSFGVPATVFTDTEGKELSKVSGGLAAGPLIKQMDAALAKVKGTKIPLSTWRAAHQMVELGNKYVEKKDYRKAMQYYQKVAKIRGSDHFKAMSQEALDDLNEVGIGLLADALEIENVGKRKTAVRKVASMFRSLPVSKLATQQLKEIK